MKIIVDGKPLTCEKCGCIFSYDKEDIQQKEVTRTSREGFFKRKEIKEKWKNKYVECPHCTFEVILDCVNLERVE